MMTFAITLAAAVVLNGAIYFPMRRLGRVQARRAKLRWLQKEARRWEATGYLIPVRFYWEGSNPAVMFQRLPSRDEFPLVIE